MGFVRVVSRSNVKLQHPWREAIGVLIVYNAYEFTRAQVGDKDAGYRHAVTIVDLEHDLHVTVEPAVQRFFSHFIPLIQGLNIFYGIVHFVMPALVLTLLWRRVPSEYRVWRNCLVASCLLALAIFWAWPLTPPRLLPSSFGFVDTDVVYGGMGAISKGPAKDGNLYAAMPSLHVGWAVWCAAAGSRVIRRRSLRWALWLYPAVTVVVVIATGNHYLLDAPAGIAADIMGFIIGVFVTRSIDRYRLRKHPELQETQLEPVQAEPLSLQS